MCWELTKILGEHAPDALEQEISERVRGLGPSFRELYVQTGKMIYRFPRNGDLTAREDGFLPSEEKERVVLIWQVNEVKLQARGSRKKARLPDLKPSEGAEHDVPRSRCIRSWIGALGPVSKGLRAVFGEPPGLPGSLHLNDANPLPNQIEKAACLGLLEPGDIAASDSVTLE